MQNCQARPREPFPEGWTLLGRGPRGQDLRDLSIKKLVRWVRLVRMVDSVLQHTSELKKAERILARVVCAKSEADMKAS